MTKLEGAAAKVATAVDAGLLEEVHKLDVRNQVSADGALVMLGLAGATVTSISEAEMAAWMTVRRRTAQSSTHPPGPDAST